MRSTKSVIKREPLPKNCRLSPAEKETVIRFDKSSNVATIYCADKAEITKLKKRAKLVKEDKFGAWFEIDKKYITVRKATAKRTVNKRVSKAGYSQETE